jgi:hypothetical protein
MAMAAVAPASGAPGGRRPITEAQSSAALILVLLLLVPFGGRAALTVTSLQSYQPVAAGTNFTGSVAISNAYSPPRTLVIQDNGFPTTNTAFVEAQLSLDNTNFITLGTYTQSVTNAGTYTFTPAMNNVTVYFRARVGATNASSIGVQSLQSQ